MKKVKGILLFVSVLLFLALCSGEVFAAVNSPLALPDLPAALTDGDETTAISAAELSVSSPMKMAYLYLEFYRSPCDAVLTVAQKSVTVKGEYLHQLIDISALFGGGQKEITLLFGEPTELAEITAFAAGNLPDWVEKWDAPCEKADLLLFSTHADDEHLFFAGVLPTYAGEKKLAVQVVTFVDHRKEPVRLHELLAGLWKAGVRHYPVIGPFCDLYSRSAEGARAGLRSTGFAVEDAEAFQVEMLRRFQPLVVLGHDPAGEYGHGQHILNALTLTRSVPSAADPARFPESAEKYGVWDTPKLYLHSYGQNTVTLDWDRPLAAFGGKSAFQVSQEAFACHVTQQGTMFSTWMNGANGEITSATQIETYSPCHFGLYRTLVGEDTMGGDFFENLTPRTVADKEKAPEEVAEEETVKTPSRLSTGAVYAIVLPVFALFLYGIFLFPRRREKIREFFRTLPQRLRALPGRIRALPAKTVALAGRIKRDVPQAVRRGKERAGRLIGNLKKRIENLKK